MKESLSYKWNTGKAKNVIIFVGDGMSPDTITASRIYRGGETSYLAWERFPHVGLLKVYRRTSIYNVLILKSFYVMYTMTLDIFN